jgi:hypothetical protein
MITELYRNTKYKVNLVRSATQAERESARFDSEQDGTESELVYPMQIVPDVESFSAWYEVVNLDHAVTEFRTPGLPMAMQVADSLEDELVSKPWIAAIAANRRYRESVQTREDALDELDDEFLPAT